MAARKNKTTLSDTWRERIQAGVIMDRLLKHFNGEIELTPAQVASAKLVLAKIAPDLQSIQAQVEHSGSILNGVYEDIDGRTADLPNQS
jgi:hypothetical protein